MRKLFSFFLALVATTSLWAEDFSVDGIYYNYLDNNNVEVTYRGNYYDSYEEYAGEVIIPSTVTYNGTTYSVTSIGYGAFYHCSSLTSITIPNSVMSIGIEAFRNCYALTSVTIGNSVTSIGGHAFYYCSSLTSITIGNSVTSIGEYAFCGCRALASITIPNSVTSIGDMAFQSCDSLVSVTIPESVNSIGDYPFRSCPSLTSMVVDGSNTTYDSRNNCNAIIETATNTLIAGCQNTIIPNSVTSIGDAAFYYCSSLTSITIPESVNSIGEGVFVGCSSLTSIVVDGSNTTYDSRNNCNAIIETATNTLIAGCQNTIIPNGVTNIGKHAFRGCASLTSITIPNSVTNIGDNAFRSCSSFNTIYLEATTPPTLLGANVFTTTPLTCYIPCGTMATYEASAWAQYVSEFVEKSCVDPTWQILYTSTDGNIVTPYASDVFGANMVSNEYKDGQGVITFDGPVMGVGSSAFGECSSLTSINIPESVELIGERAFFYCTSLTSITIPNSVKSIGEYAFGVCSVLASVTIGNSVTSILEYAFLGCSSLTSMMVENGNTIYDSRDNCNAIIESASNTLIAGCQNTIIPNSVTSIRDGAFSSCSSLTSITIPNSVTSIGEDAFAGCESLDTINVEAVKPPYLGYRAFDETPAFICRIPCGTMAAYEASAWAQYVSEFVEEGCVDPTWQILYTSTDGNIVTPYALDVFGANIVSNEYKDGQGVITFDGPITSIGDFVFTHCSKLASIIIPDSVEFIGRSAFSSCSSLTSITIPEGVTSIGEYAFMDCYKLISITIPESVNSMGEGVFANCSSLTSITIPNSVTSIGNSAFSHCTSLTSITIPNSVTSIGDAAFNSCSSFTSITIPESVTSIGWSAFGACSSLASITIPNSVDSIEDYSFSKCRALASVSIGNSVKSIGDGVFNECSSLTSITIPNSVTSIGWSAFMDCSSLTSVTIGNGVTSIGNGAFWGCDSLNTIYLEATTPPTLLGADVFAGTPAFICRIPCGTKAAYKASAWAQYVSEFVEEGCVDPTWQILYTSTDGEMVAPYTSDVFGANMVSNEYKDGQGVITFDGPVTSIGDMAFYSCDSLTSITIPNSVKSIGDWGFNNCSSLTSITIGNSVTSIGNFAFRYCTSLTSITIPNSVTSIGDLAFRYCTSLTSITIPNSVTSIGDTAFYNCSSLTSIAIPNSVTNIGGGAFMDCPSLISMMVENGNTIYDSRENSNAIIETASNTLIAGCQNTVIPHSITSIGGDAFYNCGFLTSITIPNSVTSIGDRAFFSCDSLTSVTIGNSVKKIGDSAFAGCSSLTSVTIPNSVTRIGEAAFYHCDSLTSVTIGNSVTSIGTWAFYNCSFTSITCEATTPPTLGSWVFSANKSIPVYVPCGCVSAYKAANGWKDFTNIQEPSINSIEVYTSNSQMGSAKVDYNNCAGNQITATANYGYHFVKWSDGNTDNPRTLILTQDTVLTAEFAINQYAISTTPSHKERGTTAGDTTVNYLDTITISAIANYGYHFTTWSDTADMITHPIQAQIQVLATRNKKYTAYFNKNTYYIRSYYNKEQGTVNHRSSAQYLDEVTFTATANYGYHFVQWSDGNTDNPRTITLTQDTVLTAEFALTTAGQCGKNLYWVYDTYTTTLTITGSGDMYNERPWGLLAKDIAKVLLPYGITHIGNDAFRECLNLREITIPATVTTIGDQSFAGCRNLRNINCYPLLPPYAETTSFANYNVNLNVPCDYLEDYQYDIVFGSFKYINCMSSDEVEDAEDVEIDAGTTDVTIIWPTKENAYTYTIVIKKNGQVVCTLVFDAFGRLLNISFAPGRDGNHPAQYAEAVASGGFRFTVTGLEEGTDYTYDITTTDESDNTLATHSGEFTTQSTTAVDNITTRNANIQKIMRDGQLIILRDGVEYNAIGQEL